MKLKTSYFNEAVLNKNITRFAPLWGIYLVMGVLITLFIGSYSYDPNGARVATAICEILPGMTVINFGYAAMCALVLFGDLHKTRMCYSLHAMPMRREGWFLTNAVSGLLFSLVPNLIITVIMLFRCVGFFYVPLTWLLLTTLSFVCFFGIAVFCMHITGKGVAAVAMYFLICDFSTILYGLTELYFTRFWYGVVIPLDPFTQFSPMNIMSAGLEANYDNMAQTLNPEWFHMGTAFLWAGVGIVFAVLALLVYRKRHLESAGEFITLRPAAPVVLVLFAVGVGGVLWLLFNYNFGVLLVGLALGFFLGRMMLQRTVKVFSKKNFLGYGILTGCVLLSILVAKLDPMGITHWVPETDKVEEVSVRVRYGSSAAILTDPEDIELVRQIHSYAVENPTDEQSFYFYTDIVDEYYYSTFRLELSYTLKSGFTAQRQYAIPMSAESKQAVLRLLSQPEFLFDGYANDAKQLREKTVRLSVWMPKNEPVFDDVTGELLYYQSPSSVDISVPDWDSLILALEQDWLEGNLVQEGSVDFGDDHICSLEFELIKEAYGQNPYGTYYVQLNIYTESKHTVTWLKEHGYLE